MVSSHQTFGEFAAWHPHWHAIVLEGGFDSHDRFFFFPLGANEALSEIWRLSGGKVAEEWYIDDDLGFLQQLGVIPKLNPG